MVHTGGKCNWHFWLLSGVEISSGISRKSSLACDADNSLCAIYAGDTSSQYEGAF